MRSNANSNRSTSQDSDIDPGKLERFSEIISEQRRRVQAVAALGRDSLVRGAMALEGAHRWVAPIELSGRPLLFLHLPSTIRGADLQVEDLHFVPYGWDSSFGGAFTISVFHKEHKWLGRAYVCGDDPVLDWFSEPRFCAVFVKGRAPVLAVDVDFGASEAVAELYRENWSRAKTHQGFVRDEIALFWDVARLMSSVVTGMGILPEDLLSLGWVARYAEVLTELRRVLAGMALMPAPIWPSDPDIPKPYVNLVRFLSENSSPTPADIMDFVTGAAARSHEELLALMLEEYHEFTHRVIGEHSALCALARASFDLYMWSSASTLGGRRVPELGKLHIKYLDLQPKSFPEHCSPKDYWARVIKLPAEWGPQIQGSDFPIDLQKDSPHWANMPAAEDSSASITAAGLLIEEALADRKWTIPPDALMDLPYGPFSHMQLAERGGVIEFALRSSRGEFSAGGMNLSTQHMWWEAMGSSSSDEQETKVGRIASGLYLLVAASVRDFLVVEERERVFGHNTVRKAFRAVPSTSDEPRIVYLPRVRYVATPNVARCAVQLNHSRKRANRAHGVRPHLRRCGTPSASQVFLAQRYGMSVPMGYTFVRPHERGKPSPDVIYRSRSALRCLYEVGTSGAEDAVGSLATGPTAPWFRFERDVYQLMIRLGFSVQHVSASRKGDRGVDVFASKGSDLDEVSWVIQCKCYSPKHKVGPNVVRELLGALAEYPRGVRGMIVATTVFSRDAVELAKQHSVRLIDGSEFAALAARMM